MPRRRGKVERPHEQDLGANLPPKMMAGIKLDIGGRNRGLEYKGKDEHGVPKWEGDWATISPRLVLAFWSISFCFVLVWLLSVVRAMSFQAGTWAALNALIFGAIGGYISRARTRFAYLAPPEQVAESIGVSTAQLGQIALDHKIKPRAILNGEQMWDLTDFGDAGLLLRASYPPAEAVPLLRPALGAPTDAAGLLRPAEEEPQPLQQSVSGG